MEHLSKRQKLASDSDTGMGSQTHAVNSSSEGVPSIEVAHLKQDVPEASGNTQCDLTELDLVLRRKQHLHRLCTVYETQLQGVLNSTKHTRDGTTKAVAAEVVLSSNLQPLPNLQTVLPVISRSEQVSAAAVNRELDAKRALAILCGKQTRYIVNSTAIDLGRSTSTQGKVDIDLTEEGDARKVSRKQAHLQLCADGKFMLANIGRRTISVNGTELVQNACTTLEHLSLVDLAGIQLLFMHNHSAVRRLVSRSQNLVL